MACSGGPTFVRDNVPLSLIACSGQIFEIGGNAGSPYRCKGYTALATTGVQVPIRPMTGTVNVPALTAGVALILLPGNCSHSFGPVTFAPNPGTRL